MSMKAHGYLQLNSRPNGFSGRLDSASLSLLEHFSSAIVITRKEKQ
jgi:hypothetical protein